jgi:hypothetical protein
VFDNHHVSSAELLRVVAGVFVLLRLAILATDRRIVRRLKGAGAMSAGSSVPVQSRRPLWQWRLRALSARGIVGRTPTGYFVNEPRYEAERRGRRIRAFAVFAILLAGLAAYWAAQR